MTTQDFDSGTQMRPAVTEAATRMSSSLPRQKGLTRVQYTYANLHMIIWIFVEQERETQKHPNVCVCVCWIL